MWVQYFRKELNAFKTDTNNHIESFHSLLEKRA